MAVLPVCSGRKVCQVPLAVDLVKTAFQDHPVYWVKTADPNHLGYWVRKVFLALAVEWGRTVSLG